MSYDKKTHRMTPCGPLPIVPGPDLRAWHVPSLGDTHVSARNGLWLFCTNLDLRDSMEVGGSASLAFHSGAGTTEDRITRTR